jgi:hypothetical protein
VPKSRSPVFPGTIADELQLYFGQADQGGNKDLPIKDTLLFTYGINFGLLPARIRAGFSPETSRSGALTKNLTIERYE